MGKNFSKDKVNTQTVEIGIQPQWELIKGKTKDSIFDLAGMYGNGSIQITIQKLKQNLSEAALGIAMQFQSRQQVNYWCLLIIMQTTSASDVEFLPER